MQTQKTIINVFKGWIESVVIGENFCPFARQPFVDDAIQYHVCESREMTDLVESIIDACRSLDTHQQIQTSFVIVANGLEVFDDYLDCLDLAQAMLSHTHYEGVYQLASFHPEYVFEGTEPNAPENYTNRSPYPCFHILREAQLAEQIALFPNVERIPERNIERAITRGADFFKNKLKGSHDEKS